MATTTLKVWDIYEGLKNKFLFNNDINSIHILLTLYDLEENISNIYPKYTSTNKIKKKIKYILNNRNDAEILAHNISLLIHEDINRLELCFYLEGYKFGCFNNKWINKLEEKTIQRFGLDKIYKNKFLFHFDCSDNEIKKINLGIRREIDVIERKLRQLEDLIYTFASKVIKKKIINIDSYMNRQLKMEFNVLNFYIMEESYKLKEEELDKVYNSIVSILIRNLKNIYKDAAWYAVNDKVISRYL